MLTPVAQLKNGLSGSQGDYGACRSEGLKRLVAGQHVPDRLGQLSGELDLRDLRAALTTEAALGADNRARLTYVVRRGGPTAFTELPTSSGPALVHNSQLRVRGAPQPRAHRRDWAYIGHTTSNVLSDHNREPSIQRDFRRGHPVLAGRSAD